MDDRGIYQSAKRLIDVYGADAVSEAATRADAMLERGDLAGATVWKQIIRAIVEIQMAEGRTKH